MDDQESKSAGLFDSIRRLGDSALSMLHRRLELASIELQEEKYRLLDLLIRAAVLIVLGILTLVTATALVVVVFWDRSPVITLTIITAAYTLTTISVAMGLRDKVKTNPRPFADSVEELKKDREWLRDKNSRS